MKNLGLQAKMLLMIGSVVTLGLVVTTTIVSLQTLKRAGEQGVQQAQEVARFEASVMEQKLETAFESARTLGFTLSGMRRSGTPMDRAAVNSVLQTTLEAHPDFFGVWTCWEPNAFDGKDAEFAGKEGHDASGRFIPYFFREDGKVLLEPLKGYDATTSDGDYYQIALRTGREVILEPYEYVAGSRKILMTSIVIPVRIDGRVVGVTGVDIDLVQLAGGQAERKIMGAGYASTVSNKGVIVSHPSRERIGQASTVGDPWMQEYLANVSAGKEFQTRNFSDTLRDQVFRIAQPIHLGETGTPWSVIVHLPEGQVLATARSLKWTAVFSGLGTLGAVLVVVFFVARSIANPVRKLALDLQSGATFTTESASQIASSSETLAAAANQQAASLEETSASLEELSSTTKRNAEIAANSKQLSDATREAAETGSERMRGMVEAMSQIKTSSDSVSRIVKTIDEIAFQTNILALNAAVEAARAGEAGAGFAVVADEVRSLAQRAALAAKETSDQISAAISRADHGVQICGQVSSSFEDILKRSRELNTLVAEIATASEQQTSGIVQINQAVAQMDSVTQTNAAQSEESAAAAQSLNSQARDLQNIANELTRLVEGCSKKANPAPRMVMSGGVTHAKPSVLRNAPQSGKASTAGFVAMRG
jgi:methyl-accepting chemotaxis protein